MKYRGVQIVSMNWILKDIVAEVIGLADGSPRLYAGPGQPEVKQRG